MNILIKCHIQHRARHYKKEMPNDWKIVLKDAMQLDFLKNSKIYFSWLFDGGSKTLNAGVLLSEIIIANSEWAARLVLFQDENTKNAFRCTIGHEMTHKENDFCFLEFFTKNRKFVNWINEVHADFGAALKAADGQRKILAEALKYKMDLKGNKDKDSINHPSWKKRLQFVENYDFDAELIQKIAKETGCKNQQLIQNVIDHFELNELSES